jgi:hypothetical protein
MCILRVFCELAFNTHLFPDNNVLHRNIHYVFFSQVETAVTLKTLVASTCFYPQIVDL